MRSFLAGILFVIWPSVAFAQARGSVEAIGFGDIYRPATWTPMLVSLTPTTGSTFSGRMEVVQEDLDRDEVIFTRQISLTGNPPNGTAVDQKYWMYFMPQPNKDRGALDATQTTGELTNLIKVRLVSDAGKQLLQLPITRTLRPVGWGGMGSATLGQKIVLCVYDKSPPNLSEFQEPVTKGLTEEIVQATARNLATDLPDNVIGYDAIDAILWTDADPSKLSADQLTAIEQYVRRGGRLVISQDTTTNQWQRNNVAFPLLMPVTVRGVEERDDSLATLRDLGRIPEPSSMAASTNAWDRLKGPFRYAACEAKPGAIVVAWQKDLKGNLLLDAAGKPMPYAVRGTAGAGSVTWVAQDLSDRQILGERDSTSGWVPIWDAVFDWTSEPVSVRGRGPKDPAFAPYDGGATWELGRAYLGRMDLNSRSAGLVGIALLFFVVYWVAAGPGSYLVLARKGKAMLSWFTFAAIALGATGLTVGIVKLVLRGAPQIKHFSVVRLVPNEPARVHSEFGLYIPRDGAQRIELKDTVANRPNYVTAFNLQPAFNANADDFPAHQSYYVPVRQITKGASADTMDPRVIDVPYRSTLKKFQAEWSGATASLPGGIEGSVTLALDHPLVHGTLTNRTGHDLSMVYLVVHHPKATPDAQGIGGEAHDLVLYVSSWPNGGNLNLNELFDTGNKRGAAPYLKGGSDGLIDVTNPGNVKAYKGFILPDRVNYFGNWTDYWFNQGWRTGESFGGGGEYEEKREANHRAFPLLSFYDRLPVSKNKANASFGGTPGRFDLLRRGVRELDLSPAISAGNMAIIGVAAGDEEKLPFPLEVQGDRIEGAGIIYYQFVVPVDRSAVQQNPAVSPTQPKGKAEG